MRLDAKRFAMHDADFDRREAAPRFVRKPKSANVKEGGNGNFVCRVVAPPIFPPTVTWSKDDSPLSQSVKYMQKYAYASGTFELRINRVKLEDKGDCPFVTVHYHTMSRSVCHICLVYEYTSIRLVAREGEYSVEAENTWGRKSESAVMNVEQSPDRTRSLSREATPSRRPRREESEPPAVVEETADTAPLFTFLLRNRLIQEGDGVKLIACLTGKPTPKVCACQMLRACNFTRTRTYPTHRMIYVKYLSRLSAL